MSDEKLASHPPLTPYGALAVRPAGRQSQIKAEARKTIRKFGALTGNLRESPDYLIIGTKRGGTTSLARWLLEHPEVKPMFPARETRKGAYYFDVNYQRGPSWYHSHFPTKAAHLLAERKASKDLLLGDATPYYLHHPHAAIRARRLVPEARVIALLRDPVERAFSHWTERSRQKVEQLDFASALKAETGRLEGEEEKILADPSYVSYAHQHFSYIDQGRYARGLARWMANFGHQQLLVLRSEDLYENGPETYNQVLEFLELGPHTPAAFSAWNKKAKSPFDETLKTELKNLLAPDVAEVEKLLNRPMGWS